MRTLKYLLILLPIFGVVFFFTKPVSAYRICDTDSCSGYFSCPTSCTDPNPGTCDLGDNWTQCNLCGGTNSDCCQPGASSWTKYTADCVQIGGGCTWVWKYGNNQCSTGDKCLNAGDTTLRWGDCNCAVYGPAPYKTCCDSNGNQNACSRYNADNIPPMEGDCPNLTVICNRSNCSSLGTLPSGYSCTSAACGQPACDTLAPPMTVSVHTLENFTGAIIPSVNVVVQDTSRGTSTTITTDGNGNASTGSIVHLNDGFLITPNANANAIPCTTKYICGNGAGYSPTSPNPFTATNAANGGCTVNNGARTIDCTFYYTPGTVSGHVYVDYNHNGVYEPALGDSTIPGVTVGSNGQSTQTVNDGSYTISGVHQGAATVTLTVPAGYMAVNNVTTQQINEGPNVTGVDFYITPLFTISGRVYKDNDKSKYYNIPIDTIYNGSGSVSLSGPTSAGPMSLVGGSYTTGAVLTSGTYTLTYAPPLNYQMTYPVPPSLTVTVGWGANCNTNNVHDALCDANGNIIQADFGITNEFVWLQGYCSDLRNDTGFTDSIPAAAACGCSDGAVATCQSASLCANPGIIFSGNSSYDFGLGQASVNNWVVGGTTTPESFTPVNTTLIRSSYEYLSAVASQNGITPTDISTVAGCAVPTTSCSPTSITSGIYTAPANTILTGLTVPADTHVVLLVAGDITIKGNIVTPPGSTLTISSARDIIVDPTIGEASVNSTSSDMQGLFSADRSFWIKSAYLPGDQCKIDGTPKDLKLNIQGSVIVNAYHLGGSYQNDRDLCTSDLTCPASTITFRPDFILNAPAFIKHKNAAWQELAP